ncbi:hypothetical protein [Spirosoma agri]|uniref:Uncharacterized protein n=1 Tax=Spirosoma agri TaxID=1987381 RepID=A0A6M0IRX3_9BACT|nr:hypothetical protein [Spirosoma agri]NEU69723.1 hypothetical protein [Spirosoma agri]
MMPFSKEYYQTWLLSLEARQLEVIEVVLKIEVEVYEIQKLLLEVKELDEYDNFIFGNLIFMENRFKNRLRQYYNELEGIDLDIAHCQFIISRFNRNNGDDI